MLRLAVLIELAIIVIVLVLYAIKPTTVISSLNNATSTPSYGGSNYQASYNQLLSNLKNPDVVQLASAKTVLVPGYQNNTVFYNATYGLYNNYTVSGNYNITFTAPYDGYLILYVQKTNAPIFTYGFYSNSNSSAFIECPNGCATYNVTPGVAAQGISGFSDSPAANTTFYHFIPVLRGNETFSIQNDNNYPISITFSLTYVEDKYSNETPLTTNYSS